MTFRGGRERRNINPETQTGTNTGETGGTNIRIEVLPGTKHGMITEASTIPGIHIGKNKEATRRTLGTSLKTDTDSNMTSMIKKMSIERRKVIITGIIITQTQETDLEEAQEDNTEINLETGMMEEDRGRGVTAPGMVEAVDMIIGEVMPAMGADAEMVARRP